MKLENSASELWDARGGGGGEIICDLRRLYKFISGLSRHFLEKAVPLFFGTRFQMESNRCYEMKLRISRLHNFLQILANYVDSMFIHYFFFRLKIFQKRIV